MLELFLSLLLFVVGTIANLQCNGDYNQRVDCYPEHGASKQKCEARGCCWMTANSPPAEYGDLNVPFCFFPKDFPSYKVDSVKVEHSKTVAHLTRTKPSGQPRDINNLRLSVSYEGPNRLRLRFEDANVKRWEPPIPLETSKLYNEGMSNFQVTLRHQPFGVTIHRKGQTGGPALFDTASMSAPLIFADQFLQLTAALGTKKIFGIGQQRRSFMHDLSRGWKRIALWSRDEPPRPKVNLYGVHNFMLALLEDGSAFGVFFLNSNAQEVLLQPAPAITYRTIGGILDFFFFSGPSPQEVIQQYTQLIGRPALPPYWAFGFHISRWGYWNTEKAERTLWKNVNAGIPIEAQWLDIEYMDKFQDWTYDRHNFGRLPYHVENIRRHNMRFVAIIDPAISNANPGNNPVYDTGIAKDVFIKKADGKGPLIGRVWPGTTAFPDFTAPGTEDWWHSWAVKFYKDMNYDGLWLDMNEPANFADGSIEGCPGNSRLDHPPYVPGIHMGSLFQKTLCASAKQHLGRHYDLHSMYGLYQAKATFATLRRMHPEIRPFVVSRSTFPGSGRYTGLWTGDNTSNWPNMLDSIIQMLNFNLFGVPMVGADVCGYFNNAWEELCVRWMQLSVFYPFMRNHNGMGTRDQDPASWNQPARNAMRYALHLRYAILPYLYTQFYLASTNGTAVIRPLFFDFPNESGAVGIVKQFMFGPSILVSPVLSSGAISVDAYMPRARWCDLNTGAAIIGQGRFVLSAPWDRINAHIRGGSVIPMLPTPVLNTRKHRGLFYQLRICLDQQGRAKGLMFMDDTQSPLDRGTYTIVEFTVENNSLKGKPVSRNAPGYTLGSFWISGVDRRPNEVKVNGATVEFNFDTQTGILTVNKCKAYLLDPIEIHW